MSHKNQCLILVSVTIHLITIYTISRLHGSSFTCLTMLDTCFTSSQKEIKSSRKYVANFFLNKKFA